MHGLFNVKSWVLQEMELCLVGGINFSEGRKFDIQIASLPKN